jgi:hypothetical protein
MNKGILFPCIQNGPFLHLRYYLFYLTQIYALHGYARAKIGLTKSSFWYSDNERIDVWFTKGPTNHLHTRQVGDLYDTKGQWEIP